MSAYLASPGECGRGSWSSKEHKSTECQKDRKAEVKKMREAVSIQVITEEKKISKGMF